MLRETHFPRAIFVRLPSVSFWMINGDGFLFGSPFNPLQKREPQEKHTHNHVLLVKPLQFRPSDAAGEVGDQRPQSCQRWGPGLAAAQAAPQRLRLELSGAPLLPAPKGLAGQAEGLGQPELVRRHTCGHKSLAKQFNGVSGNMIYNSRSAYLWCCVCFHRGWGVEGCPVEPSMAKDTTF